MTDANALVAALVAAVKGVALQALSELAYQFPASAQGPGGVTATVLLAESHACIHTWPEQSAVTLDVYVCNFGGDHSAAAHALMGALIALFDPLTTQRHSLQRGSV
jgi:S-adenosylmethionine decarboxylase